MQHKCKGSEKAPFTVENKGDGWYLYAVGCRGPNPINFCPCCGADLSKEEKEAKV